MSGPDIDAMNGAGIGLAGAVYVTDERRSEDKSRMLALWLDLAVPLWIVKYQTEKWTPERRIDKAHRAGQLIAEKADLLIRAPTKPKHHEERADLLNALAAGVAAMAWCPGGVTVFGRTFAVHTETAPPREHEDALAALDRAISTWMGEGGG